MSIDVEHVRATARTAHELALRALVGVPVEGDPFAVAAEAAEQALALREALDDRESEDQDKIEELEEELSAAKIALSEANSEIKSLRSENTRLELQIQALDAKLEKR